MTAGIVFGLLSYGVIIAMKGADRLAKSGAIHPVIRGLIAGSALAGMGLLFGDAYLGLGLEYIEAAFSEQVHFGPEDPLLKTLATFLTLGGGGSGGFVTPILYIGATGGNVLAQLLDAKIALFAALGFVSLLSGTTNAPIASTLLAAELFGVEVAHFAAVSATISYLISSKKSVFDEEIIEVIEVRFRRHVG